MSNSQAELCFLRAVGNTAAATATGKCKRSASYDTCLTTLLLGSRVLSNNFLPDSVLIITHLCVRTLGLLPYLSVLYCTIPYSLHFFPLYIALHQHTIQQPPTRHRQMRTIYLMLCVKKLAEQAHYRRRLGVLKHSSRRRTTGRCERSAAYYKTARCV
jgi:hypothetical protein